jgi:hypothetical protein
MKMSYIQNGSHDTEQVRHLHKNNSTVEIENLTDKKKWVYRSYQQRVDIASSSRCLNAINLSPSKSRTLKSKVEISFPTRTPMI